MQKNIAPYSIGGVVLVVLVGFMLLGGKTSKQVPIASQVAAIPQASVAVVVSDQPQDIVPGLYKNSIQNTSTAQGFVLKTVTVENNTDATGKTVNDHLELALQNTAGKDLTGLEVYYTITDPTTSKKEGYYKKLTGFILKNGQTALVHFDNKQGDGHFSANKNSIYYTSSDQLVFDVIVSAPGYKIQTSQVTKAAGGAEVKD